MHPLVLSVRPARFDRLSDLVRLLSGSARRRFDTLSDLVRSLSDLIRSRSSPKGRTGGRR